MVFSSSVFIFLFLPLVLIAYKISSRGGCIAQNVILLCFSMLFYAWGGLRNLFLIVFSCIINWALCLILDKQEGFKRKFCLFVLVLLNLGILCYFKYINFFIESFLRAFRFVFSTDMMIPRLKKIDMPLGISFFTFQILSYVIDLYKKKIAVQKSLAKLSLYVLLFPQLIAGPIVRYETVCNELDNRISSCNDEMEGVHRFIIGFIKKILFANIVGEFADVTFACKGELFVIWAWLGVFCYAIQIYMDFSAYSDMAIGLGRFFGFHFNENFNYPYYKTFSIREFWRKWHISLSLWFRDYLYIPLGGNRKGKLILYRNLLITFFLTGLWHGASWNYVIWGGVYSMVLLFERVCFESVLNKMGNFFSYCYTIFIVCVCWVFFRAESIKNALLYLKSMFSVNKALCWDLQITEHITPFFLIVFILSIFGCTPCFSILYRRIEKTIVGDCVLLFAFILAICFMVGSSFNPFLYFVF